MPPSFEEETEKFIPSEHTIEEKKTSDVWDVSNVDISHIEKDRKLISFTFDDAPSKNMENILAVFASFNETYPAWKASATFFINGYLIDNQSLHFLHAADILGFELGNHTQNHLNLNELSVEKLTQEIDETDALLSKIDGKSRHLLRAPFGNANHFVKEHSPAPIINWTIDTLDWTGVSAEEIYETIFKNRFSGAIVLMHDNYDATVEALKRLLPDLKQDGYQVVSVSELAKAHGCALKTGSTYIRLRQQ